MDIRTYYNEMVDVKTELIGQPGLGVGALKPPARSALADFWRRTRAAVKLIFLEKEIVTFAVLQWACIAGGYYLWVQMIGWIPPAAWARAANSHGATPGDIILFLWSFVCVGVTAFPLGILDGCMGSVHFLNRQGKESTIVECLKIVLPDAWTLWIFHWIDGWWTVMRILDRLPKKNDRRTPIDKAFSEAIYYAWKVATIGILPGLVTGRGLIDSGKRSIGLVEAKLNDVLLLRAGFSLLCWIVGVAAYIGTIFFFIKFPGLVDFKLGVASQIYKFYFWAAVPILSAVGVVTLLLRPIYVLASCDIYADYVQERDENLMLPPPPKGRGDWGAFIAVCLLALGILIVVYYRYELGIMDLLAR